MKRLSVDGTPNPVQLRTMLVTPELDRVVRPHLASFGWTVIQSQRLKSATKEPVLSALFGPSQQRHTGLFDAVALTISRPASLPALKLDKLERDYFELQDPDPSETYDANIAKMGCPMAVGVVSLAVGGLNLLVHGLDETARWAIVLGAVLILPFLVTVRQNQRSRAGDADKHVAEHIRRIEIANEALAIVNGSEVEATAPTSTLLPFKPRLQKKPETSQKSPFRGHVRAERDARIFGELTRYGDTILTIDSDWRVWRRVGDDEIEWGWIDASGSIHQGSIPGPNAPFQFQLGTDVVAEIVGPHLIVSGQKQGRLLP